MSVEIYKLNNVDPDEIGDVLLKIQRSFNIKLDSEGLKDADTLGNLCDIIVNKISLTNTDSCTTQHAFYQLRNAIATATGTDKCTIKPQTRLSKVFPRENRLSLLSAIEKELGFSINLLQPRQWIIAIFISILGGSLAGCCYNWQAGITGIIISLICLKIAGKFGKEIRLKTVGDLANQISRENYLKARRNPCAINKNEIEQKVKEIFVNDLNLQPIMVKRRSPIN